MHRLTIARIAAGALAAGAIAASLVLSVDDAVGTTVSQGGHDFVPPSLEGQVDPYAFDDGNRSIMISVPHTPDPKEATSVRLVPSRAYVRRGDEGSILVEVFDDAGALLDSWNALRPSEGSEADPSAVEGRYAIPYTKQVRYVTITDTETGVSTDVKLDEAIATFCAANPTDVACEEIDLVADLWMDDYSARKLEVGQSVEVPVYARFRNVGAETSDVTGVVTPLFVGPIATYETADQTTFTYPTTPDGFDETVKVISTLACTEEGTTRVFPMAQIWSSGGPHVVEPNVANNRWNTYFDVICVAP
jgi:hypothetical protein